MIKASFKVAILALLLALLGYSAASLIFPSRPHTPTYSVYDMTLATVLIRNNGGTGSGVILREKEGKILVLTAAHVVIGKHTSDAGKPGGYEPYVKLYVISPLYGWSLPATVLKASTSSDVAFLEATLPTGPIHPRTALLCAHQGRPGDKVWAVGYPNRVGPAPTVGAIGNPDVDMKISDDFGGNFHGFLYTAPTSFGSSGGPVFSHQDSGWCVIGITERIELLENGFYPIPIYHLGWGVRAGEIRRVWDED